MVHAGILKEDDRVELIEGDILELTPIGPRHALCVDRVQSTDGESVPGVADGSAWGAPGPSGIS